MFSFFFFLNDFGILIFMRLLSPTSKTNQASRQAAISIGSQKCNYIYCDVTNVEQVKGMVEWTVQNHGQLDIMFSNVGIICYNKGTTSNFNQNILDLDLAPFDHLFTVNARDMAACVKLKVCSIVKKHVRGSIIYTVSVCASCGGEHDVDYFMSKHAVLRLVRSTSKQLEVHGICNFPKI